jgi:hypothetical protein
MVQLTEAGTRPPPPIAASQPSRFTSWLADNGHVVLALVGSIAFMIVQPPVADLQAADARAAAAARHVGLGYWLSWFGGSTPGQYSILSPALTALVGVTTLASLSVVAIALLARPLLSGTGRPRSAAYLVVVSSLCNLWSGRVPFSAGLAVSLLGVLLLRRGRPVLGGVVNGLAALFSPLAPAFILLGVVGPAITRPDWRRRIARFAMPTVVGLIMPAVLFGAPSAMPFSAVTLSWCGAILAGALLLDLPRYVRSGLWLAAIASLAAFVIPTGVGANMSRYLFLVLPPVLWAVARNPIRVVVLALLPAFVYSGYVVTRDVANAAQPAAQEDYYAGIRTELLTLTGRSNHRVEVIDTATHRAAAALIPDMYLARGWETQSDATNNPLFYSPNLLTEQSYHEWLDRNAVAWVALPKDPSTTNQNEARLVLSGLSYLTPVWSDKQWLLYGVSAPSPIIPAPAVVISSDESQVIFDLPGPALLSLRLRPARYLTITDVYDPAQRVCLSSLDPDQVQASFTAAGRYVLTSSLTSPGPTRDGC